MYQKFNRITPSQSFENLINHIFSSCYRPFNQHTKMKATEIKIINYWLTRNAHTYLYFTAVLPFAAKKIVLKKYLGTIKGYLDTRNLQKSNESICWKVGNKRTD